MKKTALYLSIIFAFSCSCQKQAFPSAEEILFTADGLEVEVGRTRADAVTVSTLNDSGFYVSAVTGSAGSEASEWTSTLFTKSGTKFGGGKIWPESNTYMKFYASNTALTFDASGTTVSASNNYDVVVAYLSNPAFRSSNTLAFSHIFARLGSMTVSANSNYTISGITINITPKTSGTYNIRTGEWSSTSNGSVVNIANPTPGTKNNDLYLVPGTYILSATWTASDGNGYSETFTSQPYTVTMTAGKINNVSATFTGDAAYVEFTIGVTDWSSATLNFGSFPA